MIWDKVFIEHFVAWYKYLVNEKNYGPDSPLFPMTAVSIDEKTIYIANCSLIYL